jgi:hypothetical protein
MIIAFLNITIKNTHINFPVRHRLFRLSRFIILWFSGTSQSLLINYRTLSQTRFCYFVSG